MKYIFDFVYLSIKLSSVAPEETISLSDAHIIKLFVVYGAF